MQGFLCDSKNVKFVEDIGEEYKFREEKKRSENDWQLKVALRIYGEERKGVQGFKRGVKEKGKRWKRVQIWKEKDVKIWKKRNEKIGGKDEKKDKVVSKVEEWMKW